MTAARRAPRDSWLLSRTGTRQRIRVDAVYARSATPWPATGTDATGARHRGLVDPERRTFTVVDPREDPALPSLSRWLERGTLVAYRPGQRAVVRVEDAAGVRWIKVLTPKKARRLLAVTSRLGDLHVAGMPSFPAILEADAAAGLVIFATAVGRDLAGDLRADEARGGLEGLGRALAAWHAVGVVDGLPLRGADDLTEWLHRVRLWTRSTRPSAAALKSIEAAASLDRDDFVPGLVHGDLHDKNVVVTRDGVTLLDPDSTAVGDVAFDLGNLLAHLELRALQRGVTPDPALGEALLGAYLGAGGPASPDRIRAHAHRALFRLSCVYALRRRWAGLAPALLERALPDRSERPSGSMTP